jgi:hypothetical protein
VQFVVFVQLVMVAQINSPSPVAFVQFVVLVQLVMFAQIVEFVLSSTLLPAASVASKVGAGVGAAVGGMPKDARVASGGILHAVSVWVLHVLAELVISPGQQFAAPPGFASQAFPRQIPQLSAQHAVLAVLIWPIEQYGNVTSQL